MHSLHNLLKVDVHEGGGGEKRSGWMYRLTAEQEMEELERKVGKHHWRVRLVETFEQNWVQLALIVLLIVDVLCIVVELFLDAEYPNCATVKKLVSCCPAATTAAGGHGGGLVTAGGRRVRRRAAADLLGRADGGPLAAERGGQVPGQEEGRRGREFV